MHQAGAAALSQLLRCEPPGPDQREIPCPCGRKARYREMRSRRVLTAVGEVELLRPWYLCPQCHGGQFPADVALDVEKTDLSPGVRRMLALVGAETSFDRGRQQIELLAGLEVTTKAVERTAEAIGADIAGREQTAVDQALQLHLPIIVGEPIPILYIQMDGTGVPVVKRETEGRVGKAEGQPAHTREVKFGCADQHFPGAVQIVDLFHARQHLWEVARLLHPGDLPRQKRWILRHQPKLDGGKIEKLVRFLRGIDAFAPAVADAIRTEAAYFENNAERMRYPEFRRQHLFVGSGVIEAGCKTVIGYRLKQSGMFWTVSGANAIIALRCCHLNNRIENYWETRRSALLPLPCCTPRNHSTPIF